jgi:hypothetical protein
VKNHLASSACTACPTAIRLSSSSQLNSRPIVDDTGTDRRLPLEVLRHFKSVPNDLHNDNADDDEQNSD